jgi:hypothetical protein
MTTRIAAAVLLAFGLGTLPCPAQEDETQPPKVEVGSAAPNFTVSNDEENLVELKDFLTDNNVVLVFVRAHW